MIEDKYHTREKQQRLLSMMKDLHNFCEKNGIVYTLCGGSLLGAVRHNGFIPWDDDMDIMLDRANYNRLLNKLPVFEGYTVTRELWIYRIRKNTVDNKNDTIDVFVLDNCPDNAIVRRIKVFLLQMLQGMMKSKVKLYEYSGIYKVCIAVTYLIGKLFSDSIKFKWYSAISQWGNKKETQYTTCYNDLFKLLKVRYSNQTMRKNTKHVFEDTEFCITEEYDSYLTAQYGDYMQLPKESERRPMHI